ncbi:DUF3626 domain-containing protein [Dactylosporangium sp. CA-139066]|uniref:DUF3626 domain-containing protein n=1 Tax=Dactylosporangium sp. CA-139066 TaxID=3239930 RepID=UPI003D911635
MDLTDAQRAALEHVRERSPGRTPLPVDAPITVNFHPDRAVAGRTVIEGLLADGCFRSQFETGISNGGLTAYPGGDRDRWEERMFGGAYQRPGVRAADRPKYGALNLRHHDDGAAPRFGSAHLRLRRHVRDRTTFTFGDSNNHPTAAGTADAFDAVLAALRAHHGEGALERRATPGPGRALDDYVEAQIHGPLSLPDDVEAIVLDSSFTSSGCGTAGVAARLAERYGVRVEWRAGFRLAPGAVPAEFRGPEVPMLALLLCERRGVDAVDPALIGAAARDVVADPGAWAEWGGGAEALQLLKYLWHCLVRFG